MPRPQHRKPTASWTERAAWLVLCSSVFATVALLVRPAPTHAAAEHESSVAARSAYSARIAKTYSDRFTEGSHFLPSNFATDTGEFLDPRSFPTATYCGHCHKAAHEQWRESAHSNSNRPQWYLRNVELLKREKGVEFTRHCEGCHDPVALAAGNLSPGNDKRRPFDADGVTCSVCHSIRSVSTRGTGSYVLGVPAVLVDEAGQPLTRPVSDAEILAHLDRHSAAVMRPFYKTSEYCAACHKAALPVELNGYKWQRAISLYDEWQASSFARESPLPFYTKDTVSTCQTCHMAREALAALPDPGAKQGALTSHRWLGANTVIPQAYHFDEQAKRTVAFLQKDLFAIDFFGLERGPAALADLSAAAPANLIAPLGQTPFTLAPDELVVANVVVQNRGIAHSFVPEQRDMYQAWVDFRLLDSHGRVLRESGFVDPKTLAVDSRAHSFTNRLVRADGQLNREHQVWNTRVVAYNNTIQSGRSQLVRYAFRMPPASVGPVTMSVAIRYRRFNEHFMDFGMDMKPGHHYEQPIVTVSSATFPLHSGENAPTHLAGTLPLWQRWNNYGIALLDLAQFDTAAEAFTHVLQTRPGYADGYVNRALAELQWQKFTPASEDLAHALKLDPQSARALFYRALVERGQGQLDAATRDLRAVLARFPRSRDAHRELGQTLMQQHEYAAARDEYLAVQSIDPDDLASHYNLAILFRRLNDPTRAAVEAAAFAQQKDDPRANPVALGYLRNDPRTANEAAPWHAHNLEADTDHPESALPTQFSGTQQ